MKVVFLDIDGVLVNRRSLRERSGLRAVADAPCVNALNAITSATGARIVLASSWRFCGLEEMRLILRHWEVRGELIDCTPDLTRKDDATGIYTGVPRGREIQQWMDENGTPEAFAILDDDADMEHLTPHLVNTEFERGLTIEDANLAMRILLARPTGTPGAEGEKG